MHPDAAAAAPARALASCASERAREPRRDPAWCCRRCNEMTAAHRVYGRLGFTRLPERDWSPVPGVHLIAFVKELA